MSPTANLLDSTLLGLSEDGTEAIDEPSDLDARCPGCGAWRVIVIGAVVGALVLALITTRFRRLAMLATGFAAAAALSVAMGESSTQSSTNRSGGVRRRDGARFGIRGLDGRLDPGDPLLAGAVAMLGISGSYLRNALARRLARVHRGCTQRSRSSRPVFRHSVSSPTSAPESSSPPLLLLLLGRHDLAPDAHEITEALGSVGIELADLEHLSVDARGSAPWVGTTPDR